MPADASMRTVKNSSFMAKMLAWPAQGCSGTDIAEIAYKTIDAILQPMREPGNAKRCLLRQVRHPPARHPGRHLFRAPAAHAERPAVDEPEDGVDSLLRALGGVDRRDRSAGVRPFPARSCRPLPCIPGTLSVRGMADCGPGDAAAVRRDRAPAHLSIDRG